MNLTADQIDKIVDFFDTHPNVTIKDMARIFRVPAHVIKHVLMTN